MTDEAKPRRWVVEAPCTLRSVLERMHQSALAVEDGRVFVDRKRCSQLGTRLEAGTVVDVFPAPSDGGSAVNVLAQRGDLIAVAKPAGLSTIPDQRGNAASLLDGVAQIVGERDVTRVHATSRLDRQVSGVVVFAVGRDARDAMRQARESSLYRRHYVALASQPPEPPSGWVDARIGRGSRPTERKVDGKDAVEARTRYETVQMVNGIAMVAAEPETGRTHQIRVHLAHVGAPLIGDERYGASKRLVLASGAVIRPGRIALHAAWVQVQFANDDVWRIDAPLPDELRELWRRIGGGTESWDRGLAPLDPAPPSTASSERGRLEDGE